MIDQWQFTSPFEGIVNHMYLDSRKLVTCGVGFRVFGRDDCKRFPWTPSIAAAQADYVCLSTELAPVTVEQCRLVTVARLSPEAIRLLFDAEVWHIRATLQARGWQLQNQPEPVQLAIVDLGYNLGVGGLEKFTKFREAVMTRDYATAAAESSRRGVQPARNEATKQLLLTAT